MPTVELFLDRFDRFAGLDGGRAGQTTHPVAAGLVGTFPVAVGDGNRLFTHGYILLDLVADMPLS